MAIKDDLIALGLPCDWADGQNAGFSRGLTDDEWQKYVNYRQPGKLTDAKWQARRAAAVPYLAPLDGLDIRTLDAGQVRRLVGVLAFLAGVCDEGGIIHAQIDLTRRVEGK